MWLTDYQHWISLGSFAEIQIPRHQFSCNESESLGMGPKSASKYVKFANHWHRVK